MTTRTIISLGLMLVLNAALAQTGTPLTLNQVQVTPIKDTQNDRQYELYVELPEGYSENPDKRYPVLYYTDALWHIEILSASQEYIMNDMILVGISWQKDINEALVKEHGQHVSRYRDYSVIPSDKPEVQAKHHLGQAANHLAFIRNDVFKYVENTFRTDPANRSYFGYSAGGVLGAYALMARPDSFKNYILGSPALRGDIPYFTQLVSDKTEEQKHLNANVFISYGSLEEESGQVIEQFITLLKGRNDDSLYLEQAIIDGSHQTAFPSTGVQSVTWLSGLIK